MIAEAAEVVISLISREEEVVGKWALAGEGEDNQFSQVDRALVNPHRARHSSPIQ